MLVTVRVEVRRLRFAHVNLSGVLWSLLALGYSWWATGLETFSGGSTVAVLGGGMAAVAWGTWQRRMGRRHTQAESGRRRVRRLRPGEPGLSIWVALVGIFAALQMTMITSAPREDYPTISSIINELLGMHGARTLACAAWLAGALRLARHPGVETSGRRP